MNKGEVYTVRTANLDEQSINSRKAALKWEAVDWVKVEEFVNKIQSRIAKAMVNGPYIDTDYFHKRRYRLLVSRTLGIILPETNKTKDQNRQ